MLIPEANPPVKPNDFIPGSRNQRYDRIITQLSTRQSISIPLFTEATSQATGLTESPVSILSLVSDRGCQIGAIAGLELFDKLPIDPNLGSELAGIEYCHHQTMLCDRYFTIGDFQAHPELSTTAIFLVHGIRSYLGVPIITAAGDRLGVISVLDFIPARFGDDIVDRLRQRDIDLLQLVSRWLASEFERKFLSQAQLDRQIYGLHDSTAPISEKQNSCRFDDNVAVAEHIDNVKKYSRKLTLPKQDRPDTDCNKLSSKRDFSLAFLQIKADIQFKLLTHLAQKLRTPLTSILGMASVLQQEIYGPLSNKQKDYLGIIHSSGQKLVGIIDEITQLTIFDNEVSAFASQKQQQLNLKLVDLGTICQLAIHNLEPLLQQKQQQISIDLSKENRLCLLDKDKVQQIIYYLSLSLIQGSGIRHQISILLQRHSANEISNSTDRLQLEITTTDPLATLFDAPTSVKEMLHEGFPINKKRSVSMSPESMDNEMGQDLQVSLGLSLSYTLAAIHGGNIELIPHRYGYRLTLFIDNGQQCSS
jgi:signal transduction histidine kinase